MIKPLVAKIKPAAGLSHGFHLALLILLPLVLFALVRLGNTFREVAFAVILLSKWRMFAVRPRFWPANIRANAIDIIVGLSVVLFMTQTSSHWIQLTWTALYALWLIFLKPASGSAMTSVQAMIGQLCGLMAVYLTWSAAPLLSLVLATGLVCYLAARHFFDSFDEPYAKLLAYLWGYFATALAWLLGHWLLFYSIVSQPTLILTVVGYGLAALYFFSHEGKLSVVLKREFLFIMGAILIVILFLSDWGDKVV